MALSEAQVRQLVVLLRVVGFISGAAITGLGFYTMIRLGQTNDADIKQFVLNIYRVIFGVLIMVAELRLIKLLVWFSFLVHFIGLGGFYIFVGGLALGDEIYEWVLTGVTVAIGLTYCYIGCLCSSVEHQVQAVHKVKAEEGRA